MILKCIQSVLPERNQCTAIVLVRPGRDVIALARVRDMSSRGHCARRGIDIIKFSHCTDSTAGCDQ